MRFHDVPPSLISLITILIARPGPTQAFTLPLAENTTRLEDRQIAERGCDNPCGYYGQVCCSANQVCYTDQNNQATCSARQVAATAAAVSGQWQLYTTTYVQTDLKTVTTILSSWCATTTTTVTATTSISCSYSLNEVPCGNVCCSYGQYCMASGQCAAVGGGSSSSFYSAPSRPTSATILTVYSTGSVTPTTTVPYLSPVATNGSSLIIAQPSTSGSLSGGAIAGIVIGTILGIILLLLICACLCFKGLIDGILGVFGLGPRSRRRREETYIEKRHSHRSGRGERTWFGTRPARADRKEVIEKRSGGGLGGLAALTAGLGGLALVLGLKRRSDRSRYDDKSSDGRGSSYYSTEYTSSSELY